MALETTDIQNRIIEKFADRVSDFRMEYDILTFEAAPEIAKEVIRYMKEDEVLRFNFLTDLCGVHYPDNDKEFQFAVVYLLHNWIDNVRVRIKSYIDADKVEIATVSDIFASANWMERETYDFYGIVFTGHPNMKRILNDNHMVVFPMRKEYPMEDSGRSDKDDRFFGRTTNNYQPK
ncbi:NADH-quinone oxidoreductase subunit C [Dysgonomonas sp. 520]|uniref:NADH-quinone oxidoreductase subunit C n=1 Tax=Dysgonomonas sp. 520 TaxID=2302931 RepID=UPI0013D315C4|nr:NADH-quinone oxidoreductase subunit C [Dysgonomonas sp. 520]NDW08915.1 NADH-quinone oxidoreductase subunit C [Dysgonomonas sp. 520]